ncbi:MAG: GGDEF domain-containing protein [Planctomycetales bacterium]|nr:GGDEF domain-containing protein [Planctomycetales bacterium]
MNHFDRVAASPDLPTLPAIALRLVELLSDDNVSIREIGELIKSDPALTVRLLKTANSSIYGPSREITTIESALVTLGQNAVTTLALSFSLVDSTKCLGQGSNLFSEHWLHSIAHASAAEYLGRHVCASRSSELFLCGLLSDVGRLAMLKAIPQEYRKFADRTEMASPDLCERETEAFGFHHAEMGAHLLRTWRMPSPICSAVEHHHAVSEVLHGLQDRPEFELIRLTAFAAPLSGLYLADAIDSAPIVKNEACAEFGFNQEEWNGLVREVHNRISEVGELLHVETSQMLDPVDIIARANSQLVKITVQSQALAAEALTQRDTLRLTQDYLERENSSLKQRVVRDPLTNVFNRSFFEEYFDKEAARSVRERTGLAVLFSDVDHFKRLNDTFGHQFGDAVLKQVAKLIQQSLRATDIVARYGGEEFVALVANADPIVLSEIAARVRSSVACLRPNCNGQTATVTISVGVSYVAQVDAKSLPCIRQQLIAEADKAMYWAKQNGRNQVRFFQDLSIREATTDHGSSVTHIPAPEAVTNAAAPA